MFSSTLEYDSPVQISVVSRMFSISTGCGEGGGGTGDDDDEVGGTLCVRSDE